MRVSFLYFIVIIVIIAVNFYFVSITCCLAIPFNSVANWLGDSRDCCYLEVKSYYKSYCLTVTDLHRFKFVNG